MKQMDYTFQLNNKFLTRVEMNCFTNFLNHYNLDENIWNVFESLFKSGTKETSPLILRIFYNSELSGAVIIIKCTNYGRALFSNKFFANIINFSSIPFYLWIKFGCCMDMMSNPGFVKEIEKENEIFSAASDYMKRNFILAIVNDYSKNSHQYQTASILPALPHAQIDISKYRTIQDYINNHKNINRKANSYRNKGGSIQVVRNKLSETQLENLKNCFISTAENSVFYLPYQDLYFSSAIETSQTNLNDVYYFIATLNGEFIGYQAAIKSGTNLNALHGAFNRNRKSNYHAYDLLILQMTKFAIENNLKLVDFGAVVNITKQRMVNTISDMSYYLFSKYQIIQWLFKNFLKLTKVQGNKQLNFRNKSI